MKFRLLIFLLLFFSMVLNAQETEPEYEEEQEYYEEDGAMDDYIPKFSFGIEVDLGIPLGAFNDNLGRLAVGGGGSFLVRTNPSSDVPVFAGISGRVMIYDQQSQNQLILIDGFTVDARLATRNNIFMGHAVLRILPPVNSGIQPFIDGMLGFKNLFTRTTLEDRSNFGDSETIESYIEQGDWALSYGGAVGFQVVVGGNEEVIVVFEGRCSYLGGNAADYLVRIDDPNVQIIDTIDAFEEKNSPTDMIIPQIGVSFVF